ncbi:hypothetical protein [Photobacterium galatheae]|uniref:Uncharacterized protein n=1 Tax=Photobacterium galatheae TaxID=1654360 RepID=A0A066RKI6_9GAMM|nr:hypothetical protein [Photobacterium galatheae]KDM90965.1 hypothetical protein EA58_14515 [Photobacterium galatheae]MCM0149077.1 hypothetical protein [Photobacterium galatheae]
MDDDTLAPMADALSATLAVIVLLICFFILAQVVAVSKQIEIQKVGEQEFIKRELDIEFGKLSITEGKLQFFKSFDNKSDADTINQYLKSVKAICGECDGYKIVSNYPAVDVSQQRSQRRALSNAIKMIPFMLKHGMNYEIEISSGFNFYFIDVQPVSHEDKSQ